MRAKQERFVCFQDIPSTGLDRWYKLEARTQRSTIQGRIRLKLRLSTREDRGTSEEDNWGELRQQERLYTVFLNHEMNKQRVGHILLLLMTDPSLRDVSFSLEN